MRNKNLSCAAVITDAYHMKGLVKIKSFTAKPENLCSLKCFNENGDDIVITKYNGRGIFQIKDIESRTAAEKLIGSQIYVNLADLPIIEDEDEFYMDELTGLKVFDQKGALLGHVAGCFNFGAGDILEIDFDNGPKEMYAFTKENFPEVNRERIVIKIENLN